MCHEDKELNQCGHAVVMIADKLIDTQLDEALIISAATIAMTTRVGTRIANGAELTRNSLKLLPGKRHMVRSLGMSNQRPGPNCMLFSWLLLMVLVFNVSHVITLTRSELCKAWLRKAKPTALIPRHPTSIHSVILHRGRPCADDDEDDDDDDIDDDAPNHLSFVWQPSHQRTHVNETT